MRRGNQWLVPALGIAGISAICAVLIALVTGYPARPSGTSTLIVMLTIIAVLALLQFFRFLYRLWREDEEHPISMIKAGAWPALLDYAPIIAAVFILSVFLYSMTFLKSMIVAVTPFWADAPLAAIDRALHLDPQALALAVQPSLPALGVFYALWHLADLGGIIWVLNWRSEVKGQLILGYMLTWTTGMIFAYLFASAGPIFTGSFDPAIAPGSVRAAADFLWQNYLSQGAAIGGGISAFPSMHVAVATWFAFVLRAKGLAAMGVVYVAAVFACSILLGWHYSVDGPAGVAIAIFAHKLAGEWLKRRSHAATSRFTEAAALN